MERNGDFRRSDGSSLPLHPPAMGARELMPRFRQTPGVPVYLQQAKEYSMIQADWGSLLYGLPQKAGEEEHDKTEATKRKESQYKQGTTGKPKDAKAQTSDIQH